MGYYGDMWRYCQICNENVTIEGTFLKDSGLVLYKFKRDLDDFAYAVEEKDRLVLCFRGTINIPQWISNFEFLRLRDGYHIHEGFWDSWMKFEDDIKVTIIDYITKCEQECKPIVIVF